MEQKICQSCGMPIDDSTFGKEADGSKNQDYCHYLDEFNKDSEVKYTVEEARKTMKEFFPQLKRWK